MRSCPFWVVAALLVATVCLGQDVPVPVFRYHLHGSAGDIGREITVLTPDNDLIVLLSLKDNQWALKRVRGWDTDTPQEDSLALDGGIPGEEGHADSSDLTINPARDIAVVRLSFHRIEWTELSGTTGRPGPDAVVFMVDLRRFSVISSHITKDPIIAADPWRFNKEGELIAIGLEKSGYRKGQPARSTREAGTYMAEVLKVPDLQPVANCSFGMLYRFRQESWAGFEERMKKADGECAPVLEAGGASSLKDLQTHLFNYAHQRLLVERKVNADAFARADLKNDRRYDPEQHCYLTDVDPSDRLADYHCEFSSLFRDFYNAIEVFSIADGKRVFILHIPPNKAVSSMLATSHGTDFLLLVHGGTRLEVYRLQ